MQLAFERVKAETSLQAPLTNKGVFFADFRKSPHHIAILPEHSLALARHGRLSVAADINALRNIYLRHEP